jgi:hypothetical protein
MQKIILKPKTKRQQKSLIVFIEAMKISYTVPKATKETAAFIKNVKQIFKNK